MIWTLKIVEHGPSPVVPQRFLANNFFFLVKFLAVLGCFLMGIMLILFATKKKFILR